MQINQYYSQTQQLRFRNLTSDIYAVSWLHFINQVIMSIDNSRVRRLTGRHVLRRLLNFDLLSSKINKCRDVMTSKARHD